MRYLLFVLLTLITFACSSGTTTSIEPSKYIPTEETSAIIYDTVYRKNEKDIVFDLLYQLPEVLQYHRYIDSLWGGSKSASMIIAQEPTNDDSHYIIHLGVVNDRFIPSFTFLVSPNNNPEVRFFDTVNDTVISLEDWQHQIGNK